MGRAADCQSQKSLFESGLPQAWTVAGFVLGLRAEVDSPQNIWELIAKQVFLLWQTADLERGCYKYSEIYPRILQRESPFLKRQIVLKRDFTSLKLIRGALFRPKLCVSGLSWHNILWYYTGTFKRRNQN
jgi:hypothetical protein